jgi:uncharacterized membrane protein YphA (DoxX/SURF4 family)
MAIDAIVVYGEWIFLAARLLLAATFFIHGYVKVFSPKKAGKGLGWPAWLAFLLGIAEYIAAILMLGIFPRIGAIIIAVIMLGAIYHKLFIWKSPYKGGWEIDLLLLMLALLVLVGNYGLVFIGL